MSHLMTPADRAAFGRCRRQWDLGARGRRNLQPLAPVWVPDLARAIHEAPPRPGSPALAFHDPVKKGRW